MILGLVCTAEVACVLMLVLLPTLAVAAPFGMAHALVGVSPAAVWSLLGAFGAAWVLAMISAVTVARVPPGHIPLWLYSREPGDQAYFHNVLQAVEKKLDGSLRFCRKCGAFKPDLAHYSRELGLCILCYQHWDVWSGNAIGFYNHKMYILALGYGALAHTISLGLLLPGVLRSLAAAGYSLAELPSSVLLALWVGGEASVGAYASLAFTASALLGSGCLMWLAFHLMLIARGTTAHSFFRQASMKPNKPPKVPIPGRPFDLGVRRNMSRVCGRHPLMWLLPTNQGVEGNGIFFELNLGEVEVPWARFK